MPIVKANGLSLNYSITGQGDPLVMIMGLSADQRGWNAQIPFFKKYFQVITFDNRGVGKSDKPAGPYTIKMMADDTIGLMDSLVINQAHIMGISMGGMIAQEIAINYPQRVKKVVLASTYARIDNNSSGPTDEIICAAQLAPGKNEIALVGLALNNSFSRFLSVLSLTIGSWFMSPSEKSSLKSGFLAQSEAARLHDTVGRLRSIKAPTLVIVGTGDRVIKPTSSEFLAREIPHAKLVKIVGGSHTLCLEMKQLFNQEILNFLKNTSD